MTVSISKPALNLRRELAKGAEAYSEQKFYFDSLVTNGTFDTNIDGWTDSSTGGGSIAWDASGYLNIISAGGGTGYATQIINTVVGRAYSFAYQVITAVGGNVHVYVGDTQGGSQNYSDLSGVGTVTASFVATGVETYITLREFSDGTSQMDNISVFQADANDDAIFTMPKGWKPKDVFEDGLLQREGSSHDYEVIFDGFDYVVKPTVAPTASTETAVIGVKA